MISLFRTTKRHDRHAATGKRSRYRADIAFLDLMMNMLMRCAFVLMAYILISTITNQQQNQGVPEHTDALVIMQWNDCSDDDMDLWVRDPKGNRANFNQKEAGLMTLDRDDQGKNTDSEVVNGVLQATCVRKEVVSIHALIPGEYVVNGYFYARRDNVPVIQVKVTAITLQPSYQEVYNGEIDFTQPGQEHTFVHLFFDDQKHLLRTDKDPFTPLYEEAKGSSGLGGNR